MHDKLSLSLWKYENDILDKTRYGIYPFIPLNIDDQDEHYVDIQLKQLQVENPILINPGAGWVTKRWSAESTATSAPTDVGPPPAAWAQGIFSKHKAS